MAKATKANLKILQGSDFTHNFVYTNSTGTAVDLTGYTARCQFRADIADAVPIFDATTENAKLTNGGVNGTITLIVSDSDSDAFTDYRAVYDLEIIAPDATVTRIVQGTVTIDRQVTR